MNLKDFDFSAIARTGVSLDELSEALRPLCRSMNPPHVITAPDGIPLSDTEYANLGLGGAWSLETGEPLNFRVWSRKEAEPILTVMFDYK